MMQAGMKPSACLALANEQNITTELSGLGMDIIFVGPIMSSLIRKGFSVMTF